MSANTKTVKYQHDVQFDYLSPHNGEYWYKCVLCGASDWVAEYSDPPTFEETPCKKRVETRRTVVVEVKP